MPVFNIAGVGEGAFKPTIPKRFLKEICIKIIVIVETIACVHACVRERACVCVRCVLPGLQLAN